MPKLNVGYKRNVEDIRRKNLEDNRIFLEQLLVKNIRDDFVNSARSIVPKKEYHKVQYEKVEHSTRYSLKVKSGEISAHIPEWEQKKQEKEMRKQEELLKKEMRKQEGLLKQEMRRQEELLKKEMRKEQLLKQEMRKEQLRLKRLQRSAHRKWSLLYQNDTNPYQRTFKPRNTKIHERIQKELVEDVE